MESVPELRVRYGARGLEASGDGLHWFAWCPPPPTATVLVRKSEATGLLEQSVDGRIWSLFVSEDERARNQRILSYCRDAAERVAHDLADGKLPLTRPAEIKSMTETALLLDGKTQAGEKDGANARATERRIPDFSQCTKEELEVVFQYGVIEQKYSR